MDYNTALEAVVSLCYRDKLRLAQLLIQLARKEEEEQSVKFEPKQEKQSSSKEESLDLNYVKERLLKSKPSKLSSLENFIDAMFQFKGSISESNRNQLIKDLQKKKFLRIENNKVTYL
ncbi:MULTISPECIES: hypothetical protein [Acinetobacter]|uniref:hypothetical protein n=1 Tax=Acinetobacter TaxID=469 RepID=UPI000C2C016B|nr:hypothetical protein [Acinetobacter haemolyticus]ATZ68186.1 hypothetical protein BSR56_13050 [Acinetobacter haemolyticus]NAS09868.1 hypothetical protein [Acinetobacter haemolyticus]RSN77815.1 hypothetical protein EA769_03075 [Acinetobacter haemolyticus]